MTARLPARCSASLAALLAASVAACGDQQPLAPPSPRDTAPARAFTVAPDVLSALDDAATRLASGLAPDARAPMRAALAELRAALDAGARARRDRALAGVRELLAPAADSTAADGADRAAIAVLLDAAAPDSAPPR